MESSIFRFILAYSKREQILLVLFTLAAFPFLYLSLELPKTIINEAIGGREFPVEFFGNSLEQIPYLFVLSGLFLGLVLINGTFKYFINVYRGVVGERMLRRLRYNLYQQVLRFPLPQFRRMSQGELVSMITAETEPLGGYIGDAIALPVFQGGTLLVIIIFMFVQEPLLGTAAIALYPLQTWLIPKLQRRVNQLKKERVREVRRLSEQIGETVAGVREVHSHGTQRYEMARFSFQVGLLFEIRYQIFRQKFFIKFLNNFIAQVTPFFFYALGGYLVIKGDLSFGALVAVLAAYKDLSSPWKELLNYYQIKEDARVKYDLLFDTFEQPGLLNLDSERTAIPPERGFTGPLLVSQIDLSEPDGSQEFSGQASFRADLPATIAIVGQPGSGRALLAQVLAGIKHPVRGSVTVAGVDVNRIPRAWLGTRVAYLSDEVGLRSGTVLDNISYGLKQSPHESNTGEARDIVQRESQESTSATPTREDFTSERQREAELSGNATDNPHGLWYAAEIPSDSTSSDSTSSNGSVDSTVHSVHSALLARSIEALQAADMEEDVYRLGLSMKLEPTSQPELAEQVLQARELLRQRLQNENLSDLVEPFDTERYNINLSVAENLLFGAPLDPEFEVEQLHKNPLVRSLLDSFGLTDNFVQMGRSVAELMVDLFADVEPGSDLFEQFSFIQAEDLPEFRTLLTRTAGMESSQMDPSDMDRLIALPFKLIMARHRLGLINESVQARLLEVRNVLGERLRATPGKVEPFDSARINSAVSIQDNILFGRLAYGRARRANEISRLIAEAVEQLDLRDGIVENGLNYNVGIAAGRLSALQRQKLALARALVKQPQWLVLDDPLSSVDAASRQRIVNNLLSMRDKMSIVWVLQDLALAPDFDLCVVMEDGRVAEYGKFADLTHFAIARAEED